jgi:arginase
MSAPLDSSAPSGVALLHYAGRAGDHNDLAMVASRQLAAALSDRFGVTPTVVGHPEPALSVGWAQEVAVATPTLRLMAERLDEAFRAGRAPVIANSRCAVALATLPVVAAHRPDAVVVWFDAHGDLNTPADTTTDFLGGLALSGPLGLWESGFGAGVDPRNAILVGARDLDPAEQELVDAGTVALVPVGPSLPDDLRRAVAGRPVYVHIDCDVLEPGTVPTDYEVPDGLSLHDLHAAAAVLAESEVVGLEVGELESAPDPDDPPSYVTDLLAALEPLLPGVAG